MSKNTFKTFVLLAALGGLFVLIGGMLFDQGGAAIGLVLGFVMVGGSYWFSDKLAIAASRAKPVSEAEAPQLYRMMRELTTKARMPMPRLYMTPDPQPNAFATGRNEKKAVVAVTRGIMDMLDEDELRGVLAHELAHIRNRDILIGSIAAAIAMSITFVARMAFWFGGGRNSRNPLGIVGLLAMMILAPLAAMIIQMAISRSREYEADRIGAQFAGTGEPLARALEKMQAIAKKAPMVPTPTAEAREHMYIVNPFGGLKGNLAGLFSTHPPTEERIRRLRGRP